VPHETQSCQLPRANRGDSRGNSPLLALLPDHLQEVDTTPSRHTGPRNWLCAVQWLISERIHPRVTATTLTVAQDLADRMDFSTGHARYCLNEMIDRTGISRSAIKKHIAYLREAGMLAWDQHGTKANIRSVLGLGGYAGTATVYAATIPASYDHAKGHRLIGTGYDARVVIDMRPPRIPVDNSPVDNPASGSSEPPSLTSVYQEGQVQIEGGFNYTPRKSASRPTESAAPHQTEQRSSKKGSTGRSPLQVAKDIRVARRVRALVNWTQAEGLRRLAFVLRPFIDRGLDGDQITAELHGMCPAWRPKQPANYIRTALAQQAAQDAELAADEERRQNQTWRAASAQEAADLASLAALFIPADPEPERTDTDRTLARLDWNNWPEVARHHAEDPYDAIDLYGPTLCTYAVAQDARNQPAYA
jgi:hypothetical protein